MSRVSWEHIPKDVLAAAKRAGCEAPLWYAGQITDREVTLERTLDEVIIETRGHRAKGITVHTLRENTPQSGNQ